MPCKWLLRIRLTEQCRSRDRHRSFSVNISDTVHRQRNQYCPFVRWLQCTMATTILLEPSIRSAVAAEILMLHRSMMRFQIEWPKHPQKCYVCPAMAAVWRWWWRYHLHPNLFCHFHLDIFPFDSATLFWWKEKKIFEKYEYLHFKRFCHEILPVTFVYVHFDKRWFECVIRNGSGEILKPRPIIRRDTSISQFSF